MITPAGVVTAAFGDASQGDARFDDTARRAISDELGISHEWAYVHQVHGTRVALVSESGCWGDADVIMTERRGLPIAIATADCVPVVLMAENAVAIVHAGWRGARAGVIRAAIDAMNDAGHPTLRAAIGPAICKASFEVGPEVGSAFPGFESTTTWGTNAVDLVGAVTASLGAIPLETVAVCTFEDTRYFSHRRNGTKRRQVTVAWLPNM